MASWTEKLAQAKEYAEKAKQAEQRSDWVDALACWDTAHSLALGSDFRDECWNHIQRVTQLAAKGPRKMPKGE